MAPRRGSLPLTVQLQRILAAHGVSERTGRPVEEVLEEASTPSQLPTRRTVLRAAGAIGLAGAAVAGTPRPAPAAPASKPSVAIVGAGLAGLRAAHWLWTVKGIAATVYEGNTRAGGRCHTLHDFFSDGVSVEHGGAFINTDHAALRSLCNTLGLTLDVVGGGNYLGKSDKYWIDGADYPYAAANADWREAYSAFKSALASAPYPQTYDTHTAAGVTLDNMTVDEWINANISGGVNSRFGKLLQSNAIAENGLDTSEQSALGLIYLLGWNGQNSLSPISGGDEKYHVRGGNNQIVDRLIAALPAGTVRYGHKLTAVRQPEGGPVTLTFQTGARFVDVRADRVILALPFTTLRDCDLTQSGFSAIKRRTIAEQGLGANAKLHVEVRERPWITQGYGGAAYTNPAGFQCGWDDTSGALQPGGVYNFFPGGTQVTAGWKGEAFGPAPAAQVSQYLAQLEPIFPGVSAAYTGKAYRDFWHANPWSKGAYTCLRPGQFTSIFGNGAVPEGAVHFAGEHTSNEFYGFLNGAVETGERAAKAVALS